MIRSHFYSFQSQLNLFIKYNYERNCFSMTSVQHSQYNQCIMNWQHFLQHHYFDHWCLPKAVCSVHCFLWVGCMTVLLSIGQITSSSLLFQNTSRYRRKNNNWKTQSRFLSILFPEANRLLIGFPWNIHLFQLSILHTSSIWQFTLYPSIHPISIPLIH